jgi:hypothetical protein
MKIQIPFGLWNLDLWHWHLAVWIWNYQIVVPMPFSQSKNPHSIPETNHKSILRIRIDKAKNSNFEGM